MSEPSSSGVIIRAQFPTSARYISHHIIKRMGVVLSISYMIGKFTYHYCYVLCLEQLLSHPWVRGEIAKDDQMDPEIVARLQSFNARRKLRAAAIASVWSSTVFLRMKKLKSLLGSYDLAEEEIENLKTHFKKM